MRISPFPLSVLVFTLAACGSQSETTPADQPSAMPTPTPTPLPTEIPAQFQGRWGLGDKDCTSGKGDAKGLLTVKPDSLNFYESTGKLDQITEAEEGRVRGNFSFKGEGMEWKRDEILTLRKEGKVLVRREFGDDASPEPFDYTKCE